MDVRFWSRAGRGVTAPAGVEAGNLITHRAFLKGVAAAVGGALLGPLATLPGRARAAYIPSPSGDTVDTNLLVQGDLIVDQKVGIGTATPQWQLHIVDGGICVNGTEVIGSDGYARACYYCDATATRKGTWADVAGYSWEGLYYRYNWAQVETLPQVTVWPYGTWQRVIDGSYSWNQLKDLNWDQVRDL